jgi:hypothetical protein
MKELVGAGADFKALDDDGITEADIGRRGHGKDEVLGKTVRALGLRVQDPTFLHCCILLSVGRRDRIKGELIPYFSPCLPHYVMKDSAT